MIVHDAGAGDQRALRNALGCYSTGVAVITTQTPEGLRAGFTANSFASLSLDPPLVLFSIGQSASSVPALKAAGAFAVNVLHRGQVHTAQQFVRRDIDRFEGFDWENWETGAPILRGALANLECKIHHTTDMGDHILFIGQVLHYRYDDAAEPLTFLRGQYSVS